MDEHQASLRTISPPSIKVSSYVNQVSEQALMCPDQEDWGEDRSQWPAILYQYEPRQGDVSHKKPPIWTTQDGYVILDIENDPVMAFEEIPDTISSVIEAPFLEAFCRLNQHIKIKDIRARMLRDPTEQGEWNGDGKDPIRIGNLSMKMTRFRERSGMITWGRRAGSTNIKAYLDSILPQVCKDENSIRRFRDLHKHERAAMHLSNIGKFPERGRGKKDLSDRPLSTVSESLTGNDEESIGAGVDDTDGAEDELAEPMENEQPMNDGIAYDNEVDTENIDNTNFLSAAPTSLRHQELVHHLLEPTREEYRCCTSQDPPETNPELSYLSQYWVIQAAFETYWEEHRPVGLETATPPQLVGVMDIVPSKISWNASPAPIIAVDLSSLIQELLG